MDRRSFIKLFSAAAVASGMGLPVLAMPGPKEKYCVRYIEAYDVHDDRMVHRLDIASGGLELRVPEHAAKGVAYSNVTAEQIQEVASRMRGKFPAIPESHLLATALTLPRGLEISSISF